MNRRTSAWPEGTVTHAPCGPTVGGAQRSSPGVCVTASVPGLGGRP